MGVENFEIVIKNLEEEVKYEKENENEKLFRAYKES